MAGISKVTRERLEDKAHYRLQLNADRRAVALLYGPLAEYYGARRIAAARNRMAIAATKAIMGDFAQAVSKDPVFARWLLEVFGGKYIEEGFMAEALAYWRENGLAL